jgi:hypothetical protein
MQSSMFVKSQLLRVVRVALKKAAGEDWKYF